MKLPRELLHRLLVPARDLELALFPRLFFVRPHQFQRPPVPVLDVPEVALPREEVVVVLSAVEPAEPAETTFSG